MNFVFIQIKKLSLLIIRKYDNDTNIRLANKRKKEIKYYLSQL